MVKFKDFSRPVSAFHGKFNFQGLFKTVLYIQVLFKSVQTLKQSLPNNPCENEVGFIGTVLELSGTHLNGTFWDNHLIPINPNIGIIWY